MTNEPPTGDGEELVEADLPTTSSGAYRLNVEGDTGASENDATDSTAPNDDNPDAIWDGEVDGDPLGQIMANALGNDDEWLKRRQAERGGPWVHDEPEDDSPIPRSEIADRFAVPEELTPFGPGERQDAGDLVEADLPTTGVRPGPPASTPTEPERSFDEIVDDRIRLIGENLEASERASIEERQRIYREEVGPGIDADALERFDHEQAAPRPSRPPWRRALELSPAGTMVTLTLGALGFAAAIVAAFALLGGSDDDNATVVAAATTEASQATATAAPTSAATTAPTTAPTAAAPVASGPPEGYTFCQVHPEEDAQYCKPYYAPATSNATLWPVRRYFEYTVSFRAPIPTNPQLPIEYKLVISGAAGPTIEQVLSGGPGESLICTRLVNGAIASDGPNDVCGQVTAPDTIYMQADLSAYGAGPLKIEWFAQEIEDGGVLRGDYSDVQPDASLPAP